MKKGNLGPRAPNLTHLYRSTPLLTATCRQGDVKAKVPRLVPLQAFYPAEAYHQNYAALHPNQPYIVFNDAPKVAHLKQEFPQVYIEK